MQMMLHSRCVLQARRQEVVICNYEAKPNPADHKTNALESVNHMIS